MIRTLVNDAIATYTLGAPPTESRSSGQAHTVEDHAEFLEMLSAKDSLCGWEVLARTPYRQRRGQLQDVIRASRNRSETFP